MENIQKWKQIKQAGADLGQAQLKLELSLGLIASD